MILVIMIICSLLFLLGAKLISDDEYLNGLGILGIFITGFTAVALIACIVCTACFIGDVSKSVVIDEKIAMYETENKSIESSISTIVENYQDYEKEIFDNSKPEDFIAIATQIYPELKSNDLVKNQMDIYVANNKKIKQLKAKKLDYKVSKWWLYFGK